VIKDRNPTMQKAEVKQTDSMTTPRDSNSPNARSIVFFRRYKPGLHGSAKSLIDWMEARRARLGGEAPASKSSAAEPGVVR
jgi:hypothetical protein